MGDDGSSPRALGLATIMESCGKHGPDEPRNAGRALGLARRAFQSSG